MPEMQMFKYCILQYLSRSRVTALEKLAYRIPGKRDWYSCRLKMGQGEGEGNNGVDAETLRVWTEVNKI